MGPMSKNEIIMAGTLLLTVLNLSFILKLIGFLVTDALFYLFCFLFLLVCYLKFLFYCCFSLTSVCYF